MNRIILAWFILIVGLIAAVFLLTGKSLDEIKTLASGLGFKAWLPIIISFMALCASAYTLWSTKLAPFNLKLVSTGRIVLTTNPSSPGARQPAMSIQLLFSNIGARQGYVNDVALVLLKLDSKVRPVLFRSLYDHIEDTLNFTDQLPPPKMVAFTSFPIKPGDTVAKKIIFVPIDFQTEVNYEKAKYSVTPYTIEAGKEWNAWDVMEIEINEDDLQALAQTTATPDRGGGQFVKWIHHNKPTTEQEDSLNRLKVNIGA